MKSNKENLHHLVLCLQRLNSPSKEAFPKHKTFCVEAVQCSQSICTSRYLLIAERWMSRGTRPVVSPEACHLSSPYEHAERRPWKLVSRFSTGSSSSGARTRMRARPFLQRQLKCFFMIWGKHTFCEKMPLFLKRQKKTGTFEAGTSVRSFGI